MATDCAKNKKRFSHVIFDMDGTLLNTEEVYERAYQLLAAECDKELSADLIYKIKGSTPQSVAATLIKEFNLKINYDEFITKIHVLCKTELENVELMPGVRKLIVHFHRHCIPMALATSSDAGLVQLKTHRYHKPLFYLFHHKVCAGSDPEVRHSKPAPDTYLVAAKRFGSMPRPENCLVFEDSPNGVQAAASAGMHVVMIPDPKTPIGLTKSANCVLTSMEDFIPELYGFPPYCKY